MGTIFKDRADAGRQLAEELENLGYKDEKPLLLGLPRGGVVVASEVAKAFRAPLDTIVARKIALPSNPELGIGAVSSGGVAVFDHRVMKTFNISHADLDKTVEVELSEVERRANFYRGGEYISNKKGRTVIIIDDGLATGVTARAAIESVELLWIPAKIVLAVPVSASETANMIKELVDDVVCVSEQENLRAIGLWYADFAQTTDDEVMRCLNEANGVNATNSEVLLF